jgi:hypothetical protein
MQLLDSLVLYVGNASHGLALETAVEANGGFVYRPTDTLEALGIVVSFMPEVVVLDYQGDTTFAEEVRFHLNSATWFDTPILEIHNDAELHALLHGEMESL